ncbi:MAG: hypothetical protein ACI4RA_07135, partial [Kiritimatiellia bacterium]
GARHHPSPIVWLYIAAVGTKADVESANIVGYNNDSTEQGKFAILAAQFEDVATGKIDLNKIMKGVVGVNWDEDDEFMTTAPQIQILDADGTGYTTYYYLNDGYVDDSTTKEGWCDGVGNFVDLEITPGSSFWFKNPGDNAALTISGAVGSDAVVSVVAEQNKFKLVGNAYPAALGLNTKNFTSDDIFGVDWDENDEFLTTAPQIQVLDADGTGYTTYYYLNDGYVDDSTTKKGWCDGVGNYRPDVTVPTGRGFWIKSPIGDVTLDFSL